MQPAGTRACGAESCPLPRSSSKSVELAQAIIKEAGLLRAPVDCESIGRAITRAIKSFDIDRIDDTGPSSIVFFADGTTKLTIAGAVGAVTDGVRIQVRGVVINVLISSGESQSGEAAGFSGAISFSCKPAQVQ